MKRIKDIVGEYEAVRSHREKLMELFKNFNVYVCVGGSYALKYQSDAFADREVHDYDFIVWGTNHLEVKMFMETLVSIGLATPCSCYPHRCTSYKMGTLRGKDVNVIVTSYADIRYGTFNSIEGIMEAKREYLRQAPRAKDVVDITTAIRAKHILPKYKGTSKTHLYMALCHARVLNLMDRPVTEVLPGLLEINADII